MKERAPKSSRAERPTAPRGNVCAGLGLLVALALVVGGGEEPAEAQAPRAEKTARQAASGPASDNTHAGAGNGDARAALADLSTWRLGPREWRPRPPLFFYLGTGLPDPVDATLQEAEAAFRSGEEHYQAGHLEHARQDFDRALDILLASPIALRDDPRLLFGFDSLVDRIQQLEVAAWRESPAAGEPTDVPAAIEEVAPLTFPLDPQLRAQVEQELRGLTGDLPLTLNERVLSVVNFFRTTERGRRVLQNGLRRAGRYRELITTILQEEGLPQDLIYLAQAESAFQPNARSRRRAVGLWQFITSRGRQYGLQVDWWVDERRDPVKSTRAAARHLHDLYQQFGDWYLAIAAYNCGPGCVARAVERGGRPDYWELAERRLLPRETRNYVPIILAVALVAKDPARYGVEVEPDPPVRFESVKVSKPTDLRRIAEAIGVDVGTLEELNPQLLRGVTPRQNDFVLYVPPGTSETLLAELPRLPEATQVLWQQHRVRRGETLSGIAARYDISPAVLAQANGISLRSLIHPGDILVVPEGGLPPGFRAGRPIQRPAYSARWRSTPGASSRSGLLHRVRRGETLWELSRRYRVSVSALRDANPYLEDRDLRVGDRLHVPQ